MSTDSIPSDSDFVRIAYTKLLEWQIGTRNAAQDQVAQINTERAEQGWVNLYATLTKAIRSLR